MKEIYISSLAFAGKSVEDMITIAQENNWAIEFSSGMPYRQDMESMYLKAPLKRMPHNYFPAPEEPFVLNLASKNEDIRKKSVDHCKKGLRLAKQSHSPFFAAHAGFCLDPDPQELGKKISSMNTFDRPRHKDIFLRSLNEVLTEAETLNIDFLIENNVIAKFNLTEKGVNPLLLCEHSEIQWLFNSIPHQRLGLLLDTAHLKVSCGTLNLHLHQEVNQIMPYIKGVHHSDNDGRADDNQRLNNDYWFLPFMLLLKSKVHVLEVKNIDRSLIPQQIKLLTFNGS